MPSPLLSLIDRLQTQPERETGPSRLDPYGQLKRSVERDLQDLFNTRPVLLDEPVDESGLLQASIVAYGLPDMQTFDLSGADGLKDVAEELARSIKRFEPRLDRQGLRVTVREREPSPLVHFEIEGTLLAESSEGRTTFAATLELTRQVYEVKET
jgi:type VI secretion system protein ImpF